MFLYYKHIKRLLTMFSFGGILGRKILKAMLLVLVLNLFFGVLFYLVEKGQQPDLTLTDAIWWGIVTMTTVGYGDVAAVTFWGRFVISYLCMLIGIGLIGYVIGFVAEYILETVSRSKRGLMKIIDQDHLIICNYPGANKIIEIVHEIRNVPAYRKKPIVLISESLEELPDSLRDLKLQFVQGNPIDEETLFTANILNSAGVIILANQANSPDSDERSFAIGTIIELLEKEHGVPIKTIVEVVNRKNFKLMQRSAVNGMISNDGITSRLLVQEFLYPGLYDVIQQLLDSAEGSQFYIQPTRLVGRKVVDIQVEMIKLPTNMQVIGIIQNGRKILNPSKTLEIGSGDQLILLAEKINDFEKIENTLLA